MSTCNRHKLNIILTFPPLTGNTVPVLVSFIDTGFLPTGGFGGFGGLLFGNGLGLGIFGRFVGTGSLVARGTYLGTGSLIGTS